MKISIRALVAGISILVSGATAAAQQETPKVSLPGSYDAGFLLFRSADSSFAYWLDGRIQIDGAMYRGNDNELASGTDVRRARIGTKVTMYRDWHGEFDVDFADNAIEMKDMWVGYLGFQNSMVKLGNFKEPFGLETLTSSKYITFMERAYIDNLSPDRHIGLSFVNWGKYYYVTGGMFGQVAGTPDATGNSEGYAFTGRGVVVPVNTSNALIHIGGAISRRTPDAAAGVDTNTVRFRARPETNISRARFITTGKIRLVDHTNYYSGELAGTYGPLTLQGEYAKVSVNRLDTLRTATFDGMYVSASYFLTGEHRPYFIQDGEFDRVVPKTSLGAWEVAARWSTMDLNDTSTGVGIKGGRGTNVTLALNWHINANFKWMLDYVHVSNDDNAKPDIGVTPFTTGDKFYIVQTRFSLAF